MVRRGCIGEPSTEKLNTTFLAPYSTFLISLVVPGLSTAPRRPSRLRVRHARGCPAYADRDARCRCKPSYEAWVYIAREDRKLRETFRRFVGVAAARTEGRR